MAVFMLLSIMRAKKKQSNGTAGEQAAELWFKVNGWHMTRTQPATKVVYVGGKPTIINCGRGGVADFTGYRLKTVGIFDVPVFTACEVKEAKNDTLPCSRISKIQHAYLSNLPKGYAYIFVLWVNYGYGEMFQYKNGRGSYKRDEGER